MENNDNKKDIPTLIEIARKKLKTPIKKRTAKDSELDHIRQFIQEHQIVHHDKLTVPAFVIYHKYQEWCKLNNARPNTKVVFFSKFKLYFNSRAYNSVKEYYINPTGFDLTEQHLEYIRNEEAKNKKKRKI